MPHIPHHSTPNLLPINTCIQLLFHKSTNRHIIPPYQIKPVADLLARLWVVGRPYHSLDRLREDEVRRLVAREERAEEGTAVGGED